MDQALATQVGRRTFRRDATTLVTGASSGIGRELARLAAADSRRLVITARREGRLLDLQRELEAAHPDLHMLPRVCDLSRSAEREDLLRTLLAEGVQVDHLVNDAGFGDAGPFHRQDPRRREAMLAVNAGAVLDLLGAFLPGMRERGYGRVLNLAATAAYQPVPNFAVYSATKAFVQSLTEALWTECRERGVGVSLLCPGPVRSEFFTANRGFGGLPFTRHRAADPAVVARKGYEGMKAGKRLIVPGFANKVATRLVALLPMDLVLWLGKAWFTPRDGPAE